MDVLKKVPVREQDPKVRAANFEEVCLGYNKEERSSLPMDTGSPLIPRMHWPSHWLSWGHTRGKSVTIDQLLEDEGFDAVFIGSGAGLPMFMGIPGENAWTPAPP